MDLSSVLKSLSSTFSPFLIILLTLLYLATKIGWNKHSSYFCASLTILLFYIVYYFFALHIYLSRKYSSRVRGLDLVFS